MCLILQGTRVQVQVLKPCKSVQESSEEVLFSKAWQMYLSRFKMWSSIDKLSIKIYEIQFFKVDFNPIHEYMFGLSFLRTLNIYKDCFKGRQRFRKCEAKLCSCKLWPKIEFALVHLSLEKATVFVHRRVLWPRSFVIFIMWWTKELCSQHLSQVGE